MVRVYVVYMLGYEFASPVVFVRCVDSVCGCVVRSRGRIGGGGD